MRLRLAPRLGLGYECCRRTGAGGEARFVSDFVAAWTKVMNADRFDLTC